MSEDLSLEEVKELLDKTIENMEKAKKEAKEWLSIEEAMLTLLKVQRELHVKPLMRMINYQKYGRAKL